MSMPKTLLCSGCWHVTWRTVAGVPLCPTCQRGGQAHG